MSAWEKTLELLRSLATDHPGMPAASIVASTTGRVLARSVCVSIVRFGSSSAGVSPIRVVVAASWRLMRTSADAWYTDSCALVATSVTKSGMRTTGASASHLRLQSACR